MAEAAAYGTRGGRRMGEQRAARARLLRAPRPAQAALRTRAVPPRPPQPPGRAAASGAGRRRGADAAARHPERAGAALALRTLPARARLPDAHRALSALVAAGHRGLRASGRRTARAEGSRRLCRTAEPGAARGAGHPQKPEDAPPSGAEPAHFPPALGAGGCAGSRAGAARLPGPGARRATARGTRRARWKSATTHRRPSRPERGERARPALPGQRDGR